MREVRPVLNWNEWLECWESAKTLSEMAGLIHTGFDVPLDHAVRYGERKYTYNDRVAFYFAIADGWADRYLLQTREQKEKTYYIGYDRHGLNRVYISESEARHELARKAFFLLCTNFFKLELRTEYKQTREEAEYDWMERFAARELFPLFFSFFRLEKGQFGGIVHRNLPRRADDEKARNEEKYAHDFFLRLAKFLWSWRGRRIESYWDAAQKKEAEEMNAALMERISAARPQMIEILFGVGKPEVLREWLLSFDKACLKKLEEIALRSELVSHEHPVRQSRKVATIDEACFAGSKAAWLLKEYELRKTEFARLSAIRTAQIQKEESEHRIRRLSSVKK